MLKALLHRLIEKSFAGFRYDATYLHAILDTSTPAFLKFGLSQPMNLHRKGVSREAWFAAKIATIRHEDCGPCAQLVVDMALQAGVASATVKAIIARDFARLTADAELGLRFAEAVALHDDADELRDQVLHRFGRDGLVSLAFGIAQTRTYPAIKRVLGYAHTCERLSVDDEILLAARMT